MMEPTVIPKVQLAEFVIRFGRLCGSSLIDLDELVGLVIGFEDIPMDVFMEMVEAWPEGPPTLNQIQMRAIVLYHKMLHQLAFFDMFVLEEITQLAVGAWKRKIC